VEIPGVSPCLIVSGAEAFNHSSPNAKIKLESNWFANNFQQLRNYINYEPTASMAIRFPQASTSHGGASSTACRKASRCGPPWASRT
jgi:hypothetical protein